MLIVLTYLHTSLNEFPLTLDCVFVGVSKGGVAFVPITYNKVGVAVVPVSPTYKHL